MLFSTRLLIAGLVMSACSAFAGAELVIFSDGRVVKAASHRVAGDFLEIEVPGGGSYTVDIARIDRIVQDEVSTVAAPPTAPHVALPPQPIRGPAPIAPASRTLLAPPPPVPTPRERDDRHHDGNRGKRGGRGR